MSTRTFNSYRITSRYISLLKKPRRNFGHVIRLSTADYPTEKSRIIKRKTGEKCRRKGNSLLKILITQLLIGCGSKRHQYRVTSGAWLHCFKRLGVFNPKWHIEFPLFLSSTWICLYFAFNPQTLIKSWRRNTRRYYWARKETSPYANQFLWFHLEINLQRGDIEKDRNREKSREQLRDLAADRTSEDESSIFFLFL